MAEYTCCRCIYAEYDHGANNKWYCNIIKSICALMKAAGRDSLNNNIRKR